MLRVLREEEMAGFDIGNWAGRRYERHSYDPESRLVKLGADRWTEAVWTG